MFFRRLSLRLWTKEIDMSDRIARLLRNPSLTVPYLGARGFLHGMDDETYLKKCFKAYMGYDLDLDNPRTFNEKLQWLKLHDRNPLYTTLVDKCAVKQWVADRIGPEYVTPTYARWDRAEDVDVSGLPERFVLKTNHDSGGVAICRDRATFDLEAAKRKLARHLRRNYYWGCREWPYRDVRPCVFAEEYLDPGEGGDLADYKLFRFSSGRMVTLVCEDRLLGAGMKETFFDEEWCPLDLTEGGHPSNPGHLAPPHFEQMRALCDELAEGLPFCRVDFYESGGGLLFGEMTLYPCGGFERFDPPEWDERLGSWVDLSGVAPGGGGF